MRILVLVHLETVLVLVHDSCTVCAERTIGTKIVLDAPDGTPKNVGQVDPSGSVGDSVSVGAR
jgi:hypothetical protein